MATVLAAERLRFEAFGRGCPHAHTVTKPGAVGSVAVTLSTTAVASLGTSPPVTASSTVTPGAGFGPVYPTIDSGRVSSRRCARRPTYVALKLYQPSRSAIRCAPDCA